MKILCVQPPPQKNGMGFDIRKSLSIQPDLRLSQAPHRRPAAAGRAAAHVVRLLLLLLLRKRNRLRHVGAVAPPAPLPHPGQPVVRAGVGTADEQPREAREAAGLDERRTPVQGLMPTMVG